MPADDANNTNPYRPPSRGVPLLVATAALCLTLGFLGGRWAPTAKKVIQGDLEVDYMYKESPSSAGGGKMQVSRVEFFDNYVVVTQEFGSQHLWATDRLVRFYVSKK